MLRLRYISLLTTFPNLDILTFGSIKSFPLSPIVVAGQPDHVFHSTISLSHKKFLFQKFLMTSLHVICGLGFFQSKILARPMLPTLWLWALGKGILTSFSTILNNECVAIKVLIASAKKSRTRSSNKSKVELLRSNVTSCSRMKKKKQTVNVTAATVKLTSCKGFKIPRNNMTLQSKETVQSHEKVFVKKATARS